MNLMLKRQSKELQNLQYLQACEPRCSLESAKSRLKQSQGPCKPRLWCLLGSNTHSQPKQLRIIAASFISEIDFLKYANIFTIK